MASTYMISDCLSIANRSFPRAIEADHAAYIANIALNEMWQAYDWRVSLASLPPFWLIPQIQDYGSPFYAVPLDYFGLRTAYLVNINASPMPARQEIKVIKNIRKEYVAGLPRDIGYIAETQSFRVYPQLPTNIGSTGYLIDGSYKKVSPQVTSSTLQSTAYPFSDSYVRYFVQALRWAAAEVADSPDKLEKRQSLYQGLAEMAGTEGLELGDQCVAPSEGLVGGDGSGSFPGSGWFL